ncbi:MAG: ATP-binding cassette domain-containing protein [Tissierellia bacterium]|nr:ATP-binding cassette domain-containing protein [Tissierellia bacterium]
MYIDVSHLTKKIKGKTILNDISFQIPKGQIAGFIGHNGSGKTMLFRALAGFLTLEDDMITIDGKTVNLNKSYPVNTGIILENPRFIPQMTGIENLEYLASLQDRIGKEEIEEVIRIVGLEGAKDKKVKEYSLGMKQRLGIAQAFMEKQELLLLDEPTNGLDRGAYEEFLKLVNRWKEEKRTVLIASHDAYLIEDVSEKVFELSDGHLVKEYENNK